MRKSFMNIKHFVDSNVRHRHDKTATSSSDPINDDLVLVERQFEDLRQLCVEAEKRISTMLQSISSSTLSAYTQNVQASLSNLSQLTVTSPVQGSSSSNNGDQQNPTRNYANSSSIVGTARSASVNHQSQVDGGQSSVVDGTEFDIRKNHKKLPIVGFLKFLVKSCHKLRQDSLLATTLTHCSHLQTQLTKLYMSHERTIEAQCLKPIQLVLEADVPNVIRLRKAYAKAHNDLESVRARYNGASQKQQQQQQQLLTIHSTSASYTITQNSSLHANINKLDLLKKELDDAETRFEQAKDTYAIELYTFVCRETEIVELFMRFYQHQAEYQAQASSLIQSSLPPLKDTLAKTPRRVVFGTPLSEHLRCTNRSVSVLVELCVHLLYSNALNEEGLFRIPGSSIKIRKLKSAINAWFVTLANNNELLENQDYETCQRQLYGKTTADTAAHQPTSLAIYSLFKDIVGQRPLLPSPPHQQAAQAGVELANHSNQIIPTTEKDEASADSSTSCRDSRKFMFDVHTVAGLLKLYLRELPEPLLGDALYDQWVDACARSSDTSKQEPIVGLKRVVDQLPKANYDNLRLLIRFLHLLTCHHEKNKMTATNLAITMAPSLIWTPKNRQHQLDAAGTCCTGDSFQQMDEAQALNMQMSSMGISASLHALIVENLINHAEQLFPGHIDFASSNLDVQPISLVSYGCRVRTLAKDRPVKSTSPTGSSTESTSSFSSTSNISNSKKSGSIDGLNPASDNPSPLPARPARPLSVHINQLEREKRPTKPPVPPAPAFKSHSRQASDSIASIRHLVSRKPPAPPIPAKSCELEQKPETSGLTIQKQPVSLRGTGTAKDSDSPCTVITRPSVPPPDRPHDSEVDEQPKTSVKFATLTNGNVKDLKSTGTFRSEFDEIGALEMIDDADISDQISPVVSLDSVSGDDSSFDNQSLDQSWTECDSDKDRHQQTDSSSEEVTLATKTKESNSARSSGSSKKGTTPAAKPDKSSESKPIRNNLTCPAPTKASRSSSAKTDASSVAQSTLL